MKRLLPAPLLSVLLFIGWLLLAGSLSPGQVLLAAVLAVVIPWWTERLRPEHAHIGAWGTAMRLTLVVFYDIVASAVTVARQILGPEDRIRPGFVWVPLAIRDPYGTASLASIITMTPGTLSVDLSQDRRYLLVHALHVGDEADLIASIKNRYEQPLIRIFEGGMR
ncbi:MAG TPA: Na+/H+ antiporter subunit E [Burkholderiaceae bacterium]|nr:Na+/H+ antiporter subunit E [Burkholderiaceae bacterium]HQR70180.1 Na+/H+ antiporter subunit E [Burkholderiaceae bacterium]